MALVDLSSETGTERVGARASCGDTVFDLAAPLIAAAHALGVGLCLAIGYFVLIAITSMVATFSRGERSENAYRVLKLLTKRKLDPPGPPR